MDTTYVWIMHTTYVMDTTYVWIPPMYGYHLCYGYHPCEDTTYVCLPPMYGCHLCMVATYAWLLLTTYHPACTFCEQVLSTFETVYSKRSTACSQKFAVKFIKILFGTIIVCLEFLGIPPCTPRDHLQASFSALCIFDICHLFSQEQSINTYSYYLNYCRYYL